MNINACLRLYPFNLPTIADTYFNLHLEANGYRALTEELLMAHQITKKKKVVPDVRRKPRVTICQ